MNKPQPISPEDKRKQLIVDSAMATIASKGYRKASIGDIALEAGVSKALVLYHFQNKQKLFQYLLNDCSTLMAQEIPVEEILKVADFFDRIRVVTQKKIQLLSGHPALFNFLNRILHEEDPSVQKDIQHFLTLHAAQSQAIALESIDANKFKPGISSARVFALVSYFSEGFFAKHPLIHSQDVQAIVDEIQECLDLLKASFYKEEMV